MKKLLLVVFVIISVTACSKKTLIEHRFSMQYYEDSDVKVCVNEPVVLIEMGEKQLGSYYSTVGGIDYGISENPKDTLAPSVVDYEYCLPKDVKIRNYSTKKINDVEVCYERISKIELPMSYCLPDTNVNVSVSQFQSTTVFR